MTGDMIVSSLAVLAFFLLMWFLKSTDKQAVVNRKNWIQHSKDIPYVERLINVKGYFVDDHDMRPNMPQYLVERVVYPDGGERFFQLGESGYPQRNTSEPGKRIIVETPPSNLVDFYLGYENCVKDSPGHKSLDGVPELVRRMNESLRK